MTGQKIYKRALAFVFERENKDRDFKEFFSEFCNVCLQEALTAENTIRRNEGRVELENAPEVTDSTMDEELDFSEELCRVAIPYGVAAYYFQDEQDDYRANDYRARFITALEEAIARSCTKRGGTSIVDVYGGYGFEGANE